MEKIEWDHIKINEIVQKFDSVISILEGQKAKISSLIKQVNDNWQSMAGEEYSQRINEDLAYITGMISTFSNARKDLAEACGIYAQCETDIKTKLESIYSQLSV